MPIIPRSSYYDRHYRQAPALVRARKPFLIKNILTGGAIFAFVAGVYAFTIRAVAQDEFEDVKVPDAPLQPAHAPNATPVRSAGTIGSAPLAK
ncbi:hypothetical protein L228DRAFT_246648 [Xylona heveae TC161]|uniref:Cytochrome c oxidase assembly factor 3 n=1 Tax=Xylona heveae (strain CBS 132557 / TC161) TaxID=1328760 RepID=A0A165HPE4_XYLHT|nr:hypothetical protein L228DRAFT_246648 [Xylona heveae TC161]KZF23800.1 hypothetical protein L228DRAFT_246648 [Xylona heveae TC161]